MTCLSYHGYTIDMKTAISLPDRLYDDAEKTAKALGIPRSQLFARAVEEYIRIHNKDTITEKLDEIYSNWDSSTESAISVANIESIRELTKNDSW